MIRTLTLILLLFVAVSAFGGGIPLLLDPSGGLLHMPLRLLEYSPFKNFLIPGIILVVIIGLGSLDCAILLMGRHRHAPVAVVIEGAALVIWIIVELLMIRSFHFLHALYAGLGIVLVFLGLRLRQLTRTSG